MADRPRVDGRPVLPADRRAAQRAGHPTHGAEPGRRLAARRRDVLCRAVVRHQPHAVSSTACASASRTSPAAAATTTSTNRSRTRSSTRRTATTVAPIDGAPITTTTTTKPVKKVVYSPRSRPRSGSAATRWRSPPASRSSARRSLTQVDRVRPAGRRSCRDRPRPTRGVQLAGVPRRGRRHDEARHHGADHRLQRRSGPHRATRASAASGARRGRRNTVDAWADSWTR